MSGEQEAAPAACPCGHTWAQHDTYGCLPCWPTGCDTSPEASDR